MQRKIEIFTMGSTAAAKVECKSCPKSCDSRDKVVLTAGILYNQLIALHGDALEVVVHDYSTGDKNQILDRQNVIYKDNGVSRMVNSVLIGPLATRIWPSVVIDGKIKSEGVLLDTSRIEALLSVETPRGIEQ